MKKISLIILISLVVICCKKKTTSDPVTTTTTTGGQTPADMQISVKIDGVEKHCNSCFSGIYSGGYRDCTLNLDGSAEQIIITWDSVPVPGLYNLIPYGRPSVKYGKGSAVYPAATGTLNLTSVATTTYGNVNQMAATFSFKTTTVSGQSFVMTEGILNVK